MERRYHQYTFGPTTLHDLGEEWRKYAANLESLRDVAFMLDALRVPCVTFGSSYIGYVEAVVVYSNIPSFEKVFDTLRKVDLNQLLGEES